MIDRQKKCVEGKIQRSRSTHLSLEAILANSNCRCCMADFSRWSKSLRAGAAIESMMI